MLLAATPSNRFLIPFLRRSSDNRNTRDTYALLLFLRSVHTRFQASLYIVAITLLAQSCALAGVKYPKKTFTLMINPAGNLQSTERLINNTFERSIALHAAEALKQELENSCPSISVILTRTPGHKTNIIHNAHFANSLNVNLFLSLHFYQETETKPHLYIYRFSYNNELTIKPSDFTFYRYDQSYFFNATSSAAAARILTQTWIQCPHERQFTTHSVTGFPCTSLIGVISPALALDIGIKNQTDWQQYIQPLVEGIRALVHTTLTT